MTETQERGNALTMIPSPLYCIYYILAGKWLTNPALSFHENDTFDENNCIQNPWFPNLHAMPPLPVVFVALGIAIHAPFSFIYHWRFAHALTPGIARTDHWSRRLDQAMIHVASAFISYATSDSWYYFMANMLYNADCFRRQFLKEVRLFECCTWGLALLIGSLSPTHFSTSFLFLTPLSQHRFIHVAIRFVLPLVWSFTRRPFLWEICRYSWSAGQSLPCPFGFS